MDNCSSFFVLVCFWNVTTKKCNTNHNIYHNFDSFLDLCRILDFLATSNWFFFPLRLKAKTVADCPSQYPLLRPSPHPIYVSVCVCPEGLCGCSCRVRAWRSSKLASERTGVSQLSLGSHSVPLSLCLVVTCPVWGVRICVCVTQCKTLTFVLVV
jgi:hypothetical protein